jgi:hypothetical protein
MLNLPDVGDIFFTNDLASDPLNRQTGLYPTILSHISRPHLRGVYLGGSKREEPPWPLSLGP